MVKSLEKSLLEFDEDTRRNVNVPGGLYNSLKNFGKTAVKYGGRVLATAGAVVGMYGHNANATTIYSFEELSPTTGVKSIESDIPFGLTINGSSPQNIYQFALIDYVVGGAAIIGWFNNPFNNPSILTGRIFSGEIDDVLAVADLDNDGIGDLTSGVLTIDSDDKFYTSLDMSFDGMPLGDLSAWPSFNSIPWSSEGRIPLTNIVPEPSTGALLGLGLAGLFYAGRRKK